ncbi:MAG: SLC13 family permease [Eubacteriales bacterium]|nr:SLC13 family permease [Eubacteriales bacterium]
MKFKQFIRQESVLIVAIILAVLSAFLVHPDKEYIDYIDFRTLGILFSLMTVMAGLKRHGVFDRMGRALLKHTGGTLQLVLVLVGLCFFGSMFITNDVALLTFVPFTFAILGNLGEQMQHRLALPVVCMQTVAANLGSMLTPIGNPQNLYLYSRSKISIMEFAGLMLPYTLVSAVLLVGWAVLLCRRQKEKISFTAIAQHQSGQGNNKIVVLYGILFACCLLAVIHIVPYSIVFGVVLFCVFCGDRKTLSAVDYSLLLTFVAFFIFIGNLGRITIFSSWLREIISGQEVLVAVMASQVTSNVPAALLLSGFTQNMEALIIGTNLGGLGTLIASMASLISYRQIVGQMPHSKGKYFGIFTASNIIFLIILLAVWVLTGR